MTGLVASRSRRTRARGFVRDWTPGPDRAHLLAAIDDVLAQYRAHLPITLRQLYYRLVATRDYPKDDRGYQRLGELVNTARRAQRIPFPAIRDDGFTRAEPQVWPSPEAWVEQVRAVAEAYRRDRQEGQSPRLVVWAEAGGMVPQLARVAAPYGVPVYSSGGFDSVTVKHDLARAFADLGHVEVLHIGDHDPSGVHVFLSLAEDVQAFVEGVDGDALATFTRLAVTPAQIVTYALPTAPAKATDPRAFDGETVQAEALPPDVLATLVTDALEARLDHQQRRAVLAQEARDRRRLVAALQTLTLPETGETR